MYAEIANISGCVRNQCCVFIAIVLLSSQAFAAVACEIKLGSDPKVSDIENVLRCLNQKITVLEQSTRKSGVAAVQGETWKPGNCLSHNKNEKFKELIVIEVQQNSQNPVKLCWNDGVIFSRVNSASNTYINIETPGGASFVESTRSVCSFGRECKNKEYESLTYLAEALQDAKGRALVRLNISNDPN